MTEIRESVEWFSQEMEFKLKQNDHKIGWSKSGFMLLHQLLNNERIELLQAILNYRNKTDVDDPKMLLDFIIKECADVANFAMMIADNARKMKERL